MLANVMSVSRVVLTFFVIGLFGHHRLLDVVLIFVIAFIIVLDGVDGWVARWRNETSETGAVLDTLADRMIENTFFIYFSVRGLIPVWMPVLVMCRGFATDALQRMWGYPQEGWRFALTRSRWSRFVSGLTKVLAFVSLGSALVFHSGSEAPHTLTVSGDLRWLSDVSCVLAGVAVVFCWVRGVAFVFREKVPLEEA